MCVGVIVMIMNQFPRPRGRRRRCLRRRLRHHHHRSAAYINLCTLHDVDYYFEITTKLVTFQPR